MMSFSTWNEVRDVPQSSAPPPCQKLAKLQRRCQFDGCDVVEMERLRKECDAAQEEGK